MDEPLLGADEEETPRGEVEAAAAREAVERSLGVGVSRLRAGGSGADGAGDGVLPIINGRCVEIILPLDVCKRE